MTWKRRSCSQIVAAWEWQIWVWGQLLPSLLKFVIGNSIKYVSKQFFLGYPRINYSEPLWQKLVKNAHLQLSPKPSLLCSWKLGLTHFPVFLSLSFLSSLNKRSCGRRKAPNGLYRVQSCIRESLRLEKASETIQSNHPPNMEMLQLWEQFVSVAAKRKQPEQVVFHSVFKGKKRKHLCSLWHFRAVSGRRTESECSLQLPAKGGRWIQSWKEAEESHLIQSRAEHVHYNCSTGSRCSFCTWAASVYSSEWQNIAQVTWKAAMLLSQHSAASWVTNSSHQPAFNTPSSRVCWGWLGQLCTAITAHRGSRMGHCW